MADLLRQGLAWLDARRSECMTVQAVYRRGAASVTLAVTLDAELLRLSTRMGPTRVERSQRDMILSAADLVLAGAPATPERGDTLDVTLGGVTKRYEVTPPDEAEPAWRYADPYELQIKVRTKYLEEV